jgi:hypothetical protein
MLFLQTLKKKLVLIKPSGPKCHAVAFTGLILPVSVCVTQISVGGGLGGGGGRWDRFTKQGYYSISLRSLYLWCDNSTNFIFIS